MTQALEFLQTVLPSQGYYCLAKPLKFSDKDGKEVSTYSHKVFETVEQLSNAARLMSDNKVDIYFAVGSLKEKQVWNEEKKKNQYRTHANMSHFRSIFVDLDCGATKDFKDQADAINSLKEFCKKSEFPKPTYLVGSGGGCHVYWSFDSDISSSDWLKLAERFKAICKHFKFKADPVCISDMARVLRVPDTFNWKYQDNPRPVQVLMKGGTYAITHIVSVIQGLLKANDIQIRQPKPEVPDMIQQMFKDHASNLAAVSEKDVNLIYQQCPQMQYIKDTGGPSGYGLRSAAASIIKFTKQQDYSVLWANDEKEDVVRAQTDQMLGDSITNNPSTCERFESLNEGGCDNCTHKGKVKSPIVLGVKLKSIYDEPQVVADTQSGNEDTQIGTDTEVADQALKESRRQTIEVGGRSYFIYSPPHPYTHSPDGSVRALIADDSGEYKPTIVSLQMIAPVEVCESEQRDNASFRIYVNKGLAGKRIYEFPTSILASNDVFRKALISNNVLPYGSEKSTNLLKYMVAYVQHLQSMVKPSEAYGSLGWDSDEFNYFVTPTGRFTRTGEFIPSGTSDNISNAMSSFRKKGTLEAWKAVIDIYAKPGNEELAFGHLVGYGSLIFPCSGHEGALVSMVGKGGSGKSTVLQSINSIFGAPNTWLTQADTLNAKMNRLGIYNNYPVTYDEITNMDPEVLSQFVYSITQGRSKLKLGQDQKEQHLGNSTWQMIMASTSNSNLSDKLSSFKQDASAEVLRIFEFYIHRKGQMTALEAHEAFAPLKENYGHAGDIFIREMTSRFDEVRDLYKSVLTKAMTMTNAVQEERFWMAIIASCITGGLIAKRLGLHDFDMDAVFGWAIERVKDMRGVVEENVITPQGLLVAFLNSTLNRTLVLGGGVTEKGQNTKLYPIYEPNDAIWCRLEKDRNVMYIDRTKFGEFLVKGASDRANVKKVLVANKIVLDTECNKVLTADSQKGKTGNTRCWKIDLSHHEMAGTMLTLIDKARKLEGDQAA